MCQVGMDPEADYEVHFKSLGWTLGALTLDFSAKAFVIVSTIY